MRKKNIIIIAVAILIIVVPYSQNVFCETGLIKPKRPLNPFVIDFLIFRAVNIIRVHHKLKPLGWDEHLGDLAREHSQDMWSRDFFSHNNPDGHGPTNRAILKKISIQNGAYVGIGENIAFIPLGKVKRCGHVVDELTVARCIISGYMDSPGHRKNILNENADMIGIGTYCGYFYCWNTQNFR